MQPHPSTNQPSQSTAENALPNQTHPILCPVQQDTSAKATEYYELMEMIVRVKNGFAQRLFDLRSAKGVSAREMSLSLGQGSGYISNLENRHNLPSMSQFFSICEYLGITPAAFFAFEAPGQRDIAELLTLANAMSPDDLNLLLMIARKIQREDTHHGRR